MILIIIQFGAVISNNSILDECEAGYRRDYNNSSYQECVDIDECGYVDCGFGYCNNTIGSYVCECDPGFSNLLSHAPCHMAHVDLLQL